MLLGNIPLHPPIPNQNNPITQAQRSAGSSDLLTYMSTPFSTYLVKSPVKEITCICVRVHAW